MSNKKVLIVYGTWYGSTGEISKKIAEILKEKGLDVDLVNLVEVKSKNWPRIRDYDGVIIGTSFKINSWRSEVKSFLKKNKDDIKSTSLKLGFFTCGAYAVLKSSEAREDIGMRLQKNYELEADIYDAFGGVLDLSEESKVGKTGKLTLKLVAKGFSDEGLDIDMNGCNDFRDWDKIQKFAEDYVLNL